MEVLPAEQRIFSRLPSLPRPRQSRIGFSRRTNRTSRKPRWVALPMPGAVNWKKPTAHKRLAPWLPLRKGLICWIRR